MFTLYPQKILTSALKHDGHKDLPAVVFFVVRKLNKGPENLKEYEKKHLKQKTLQKNAMNPNKWYLLEKMREKIEITMQLLECKRATKL